MTDTFAVLIDGLAQPLVRIGPFIVRSSAERYAAGLQEQLDLRDNQPPTGIVVQVANPSQPHLDPRLPTDPWALAELIEAEKDADAFPSLLDRLRAQLGGDRASDAWNKACSWMAYCEAEAERAAKTDRRDELIATAEQWQDQRAKASDALQVITVELWKDGLTNIREIGRITGLSRTTIYAALRAAGIEPTSRTTEQGES